MITSRWRISELRRSETRKMLVIRSHESISANVEKVGYPKTVVIKTVGKFSKTFKIILANLQISRSSHWDVIKLSWIYLKISEFRIDKQVGKRWGILLSIDLPAFSVLVSLNSAHRFKLQKLADCWIIYFSYAVYVLQSVNVLNFMHFK